MRPICFIARAHHWAAAGGLVGLQRGGGQRIKNVASRYAQNVNEIGLLGGCEISSGMSKLGIEVVLVCKSSPLNIFIKNVVIRFSRLFYRT